MPASSALKVQPGRCLDANPKAAHSASNKARTQASKPAKAALPAGETGLRGLQAAWACQCSGAEAVGETEET